LANELIPPGRIKITEHNPDALGNMETSMAIPQKCYVVGAIHQVNDWPIINRREDRASMAAPNNGETCFRDISQFIPNMTFYKIRKITNRQQ